MKASKPPAGTVIRQRSFVLPCQHKPPPPCEGTLRVPSMLIHVISGLHLVAWRVRGKRPDADAATAAAAADGARASARRRREVGNCADAAQRAQPHSF